jgi:hypothetical protein
MSDNAHSVQLRRYFHAYRKIVGLLVSFFISVFLSIGIASAQGGTAFNSVFADTTLTPDGNPYLVTGETHVGNNATLTVKPGVEFRFAGGTSLTIDGGSKLIAEGTADQPIKFTSSAASPKAGDWRGLYIDGIASLDHCDVAFAGLANEQAIRIRNSSVVVKSSTVHDSAGTGILLEGSGVSPTLDTVSFQNNAGAAILLNTLEHSPTFKGLVMQGNHPDGVAFFGGAFQSATLPPAGYPYYSLGGFTVGNGATLTLQPGLEMRFNPGDNYMTADGSSKLIAEGTPDQPIKFTSGAAAPKPGDWRGLFLDGVASLAYCDVAFAGLPNEQAVRIRNSAVTVKNSTVHDSANTGILVEGSGVSPTLDTVSFQNNAGAAILLNTLEHSPTFKGLVMQGNHPDGVAFFGGAFASATLPPAGYPYYSLGGFTVGNGATLTLQPGLEMRFNPGDNYMTADGSSKLIAEGTPDQPIKFTSGAAAPKPGDWRGLFLDGVASLAYCDVAFAGLANEQAIRIHSSNVVIKNSAIHDSANTGILLENSGVSPTLDTVSLQNNAGAAILLNSLEHSPTFAHLTLAGNHPDGIAFFGGAFQSATLPPAGYPYYSLGGFTIGNGATLTLLPGLEMRFNPGDNYMTADGSATLIARGTTGFPIRFTSAAASPAPGDWRGLFLDGKANLAYCDVAFAGFKNQQAIRIHSSAVKIENSTVHDGGNTGILVENSGVSPTLDTVSLQNNAGAAILLNSLEHSPTFTHLTMAGNHPDGVAFFGGAFVSATLPPAGYPYYSLGGFTIGNGATLTLLPGLEMRFNPGDNYLYADGSARLVAEGAFGSPIKFTSGAAAPKPGDWRGLFLDGVASLAYCDVAFAGVPNEQAIRIHSPNVTIRNSAVHDSAGDGIQTGGASAAFSGNQIEHNVFGVRNTDPANFQVNAVLNWWGDPNGPKHASNPLSTTGNPVSDGVLFDPWIGKREDVGPGVASQVFPPAFLAWPLFTSDPTHVDSVGTAQAVWKEVLPQPQKGNTAGLPLPYDFGGVQFALDWKAGDHATLSGSANGTQPFCVDGSGVLTLTGPAKQTIPFTGCHDAFDLASLNLPDGTYGGELTLTAPAGAATYGVGDIYFLSAAHDFREMNLPGRKSGLRFAGVPTTIPVGSVGAVPVKLVASPKPFNGMITHFSLDPKAIQIESFSLPPGWSGYGYGSTQGTFYESSSVGPLQPGNVAFTLNVRCLQPGNWPIPFEGNGFGLGAVNDPNQSLAYLQAVADTVTVSCADAPAASGALAQGPVVDPTDGTLYVTVTGTGFGGAAKANLKDASGVVATSTDVKPTSSGNGLTAHFGVVPAGIYALEVLNGAGASIAATDSGVAVPPSMPLYDVEKADLLPQLPGKAVTHFWRVSNKGTVDGVAVIEFGFPAYLNPEPVLVKAGLPKGSLLLIHGALPDGAGWLEHVVVPVKAGGFVNVPWTFVLPPDAVFGSNAPLPQGGTIDVRTAVLAELPEAQWRGIVQQLGASGTMDALVAGNQAGTMSTANVVQGLTRLSGLPYDQIVGYLSLLSGKYPDLAANLGPYVTAIGLGLLEPDAAALSRFHALGQGAQPLDDLPEPATSNTGLPAEPAGNPVVDKIIDLATQVYKKSKDCGVAEAVREVKDEIADGIAKTMKSMKDPATAAVWYAAKAGGWVADFSVNPLVVSGLNDIYEVQRAKLGIGTDEELTPAQQQQLIEQIEGVVQFAFGGGIRWQRLLSYLARGKSDPTPLNPEELKRAYNALEFAHFQKRFQDEMNKDKSFYQKWKDWWNNLKSNKVEVPRPGSDDPCPDKNASKEVNSYDPNDISASPQGVPDKNWIPAVPQMRYVIHFENLPQATAAAEDIRVTARLDPSLDASTVAPDDSSFPGAQFAFDAMSRILTWMLPGINLPPNTQSPTGEGWVSFTAAPKGHLATGTPIHEIGQVFFDFNPPIITPESVSTVDADAPVSQVQALGATQPFTSFGVKWAASDVGSGIRDYTIYSSENGGPFRIWLNETTQTSATFTGNAGSTYAFYSVARDRVGNVEAAPLAADATTKAGGIAPPPGLGDVNLDTKVDVRDAILVLKFTVKLIDLTDEQKANADMNLDGQINVLDATIILRKAVGLPI